ncbi:kinase [Hirsutella rhossiliensis]|uniref:Kinase n=1 Tax=Hirsutella rhossiliensis TaxID=111463 RepID=A0A9P8MXY8_9HYPO|nr:kinase [Hirsutella rhossiliensis]KAH0961197.1 kinase [Hirsutella rhossiliensis]
MDDIEDLRRRVREAESRAEEEQRQRKEEQRQREAAETSRPQTLQQYLETCHSLHLAIQVITDRSLTTQGETTNPAGRIFPRQIIPWDDFATRQEEIWNDLSTGDLFCIPAFPSQHQIEYVKSLLKPISSELGLRDFERDVVENAVQKLVDRAYTDPLLRSSLGLQGTVTFESHTNLGSTGPTEPASGPKPPAAPKARRRARGKGNRADQFCIYRTSDGQKVPALAIEYKAPHKLSVDEVITGLESEIQPERDVINKDGQGFAFTARRLTAAVVTQLFSYMIGKGIQYGYVCTGQTRAFLHIPDDPSIVYVSVCVPNLDVMDDDDETRLHRTAVAQVFAFILQALRAKPPSESWHDEAERLGTWAVEYDDILRNIPATEHHHRQGHINRLEFLRLIRDQLATDRGRDADCVSLYVSGARGSLFKVRLSSHGYTLVAKGVESLDLACLQHENEIIDLVRPCHSDSGVYVHFMFLSWAGQPLFNRADLAFKAGIDDAVSTILKAVHKLRVLHRDAEPRNILYNTNTGKLMLVDFERAEFRGRRPLGLIVSNVQNRKRKRGILQKQKKDDFARELESAVESASGVLRA